MSLFAALNSSKNGGCLYTISRLCLFQAGGLHAQHCTTCLTTVKTVRKCQCRKRSQFIATNMSLIAALKSSGNGGSLYTISRLCLFQAGGLHAQHCTTCLTTVKTVRKCQCRKRSQFIATNMSLFGALKSSQNGGSLYTISRLCLF
jgi:tetrahydromethanopterin S-methyltransferase subunit F